LWSSSSIRIALAATSRALRLWGPSSRKRVETAISEPFQKIRKRRNFGDVRSVALSAGAAVLVGDDCDAHLLPQISAARLGQREPLGGLMLAFKPLYKRVALPSRSKTLPPEEVHALAENAPGLHVVERFRFGPAAIRSLR
jgi:hypothetical protein